MSPVEISIPSTSLSTTKKPFTQYNISLRLPLRSFTLQKRFSDFLTLNSALTAEASTAPPISLPPKSYFSSSTHNAALAESRRSSLQTYLQTLNTHPDPRWRDTSAWRTFLNLPGTFSSKPNSSASTLASTLTTSTASSASAQIITDPVLWLDLHRDLQTHLREARQSVSTRDKAPNPQAQHEASAQAKKSLVRAGTTISALAAGLKAAQDDWGSEKLGEGEVRRRRDLVASARKEKDALESLHSAMITKSHVDATVADKSALLNNDQISKAGAAVARSGRVLGKETARTRELDNTGVLQLQKQMMAEQDEDVDVLAQAVRRQRELGEMIQQELVVQNEMLGMLDEDVTRVAGKVGIARKMVTNIS